LVDRELIVHVVIGSKGELVGVIVVGACQTSYLNFKGRHKVLIVVEKGSLDCESPGFSIIINDGLILDQATFQAVDGALRGHLDS